MNSYRVFTLTYEIGPGLLDDGVIDTEVIVGLVNSEGYVAYHRYYRGTRMGGYGSTVKELQDEYRNRPGYIFTWIWEGTC